MTRKPFLLGLLHIPLLFAAGCVSQPVLVRHNMPEQLEPEIYSGSSPASSEIDCINSRLRKHDARLRKHPDGLIRIMLGDLDVKVQNVGDIKLPASLRPFVRNSLSRLSNVFITYDSENLTGYSWIGKEHMLVNSGQIPVKNLASWAIKPNFVINGTVHHAQAIKNVNLNANILLAGLDGKVEAYDIYTQLFITNSQTMAELSSITLKLRLYSSSEGQSIFVLVGEDDLLDGAQDFSQAARTGFGLQWLSDKAVANLIGSLAERIFSESFYLGCAADNHVGMRSAPDNSRSNKVRQITVSKTKNGYCVRPISGAKIVVFNQYRSPKIPIEPKLVKQIQNDNTYECLPYGAIYDVSDSIEAGLYGANNNLIGSGLIVIE